jgi:GNAT superfamily N-acetyltransferase
MVWMLKAAGEILLIVRVADDLWHWLGTEAADPLLAGRDPYADETLGTAQLARWREAIDRVAAQLEEHTRADLEAARRLPRDPEARRQVLDTMVAEALSRDPRATTLGELAAAIDLARESGATIEAIGD